MCRQTLHKRCTSNFAAKYLSGDILKAKCGAPIRVEAIDLNTGARVGQDKLQAMHLEVRPQHGAPAVPAKLQP